MMHPTSSYSFVTRNTLIAAVFFPPFLSEVEGPGLSGN